MRNTEDLLEYAETARSQDVDSERRTATSTDACDLRNACTSVSQAMPPSRKRSHALTPERTLSKNSLKSLFSC